MIRKLFFFGSVMIKIIHYEPSHDIFLTHTRMFINSLFRLHKVNKLKSWRAPYDH